MIRCTGSGQVPTHISQTVGRLWLTFGTCPVCAGDFKLDREGRLEDRHPATTKEER